MHGAHRSFLPAAGRHGLLAFYDPLAKLLGVDRVRCDTVRRAALAAGQRVLDVGCGTGTLAVLAKREHPDVEVIGLDPDADALARAQRKARRAGLDISFRQGFAGELPFRDASFDRVFSTLMFHHLAGEEQATMLREVRRVLVPGGALHLVDFAPATRDRANAITRRMPWNRHARDLTEERVLAALREAGFGEAEKLGERNVLLGRLAHFLARA